MRSTFVLVALLPLLASTSAPAVEIGTTRGSWDAAEITDLSVEFPAGDLVIRGDDGSTIRAALTARCSHGGKRCAELAEKLRLVSQTHGRQRSLKLEGLTKIDREGLSVRLELTVPSRVALEVDMGAGAAQVHDLRGDVHVELGAGDVTMRLAEADVRSVRLQVGVGDAVLERPGRRSRSSGLFGRSVKWSDGRGASRVVADLGVGDIEVKLD